MKTAPNSTALIKRANTALVISALRSGSTLTTEELMSSTGLSRPTVVAVLRDLRARKIARTSGQASTDVGRQPILYGLDTGSLFAIGVDIDGPPARLVITDLSGTRRFGHEWRLELSTEVDEIVDSIREGIVRGLAALRISADQVLGVGLGLPASVDVRANRAVALSRLESLGDAPVADLLQTVTGMPTLVRNDAHLMALSEQLSDVEDYLFIAFRTGVGLAVVIDSEVFEGQTGNAGFIGHTTLDPAGPLCNCGQRGCLEAIVSKRAIVEHHARLTGEHLPYDTIMSDAKSKPDSAARATIEATAPWLGLAIANLIKTTDIYRVVIGDLGYDEEHPFFRIVQSTVRAHTETFLRREPMLRTSPLSGEEFALGGAQFILDQFFETPRLRLKLDDS